mmetsp:Transcript_2074/g.3072  ORF Transcript_2074/g.3072 Transcript_2074/m.3072 type:complete len:113 (-) Transcript_2074:320-658(-)
MSTQKLNATPDSSSIIRERQSLSLTGLGYLSKKTTLKAMENTLVLLREDNVSMKKRLVTRTIIVIFKANVLTADPNFLWKREDTPYIDRLTAQMFFARKTTIKKRGIVSKYQ